MTARDIAAQIIKAVGGKDNIRACGVCATRLRVIAKDPARVDTDAATKIHGVLGVVRKGHLGFEFVLGPRLIASVSDEVSGMTGIASTIDELMGFDADSSESAISIQVNTVAGAYHEADDEQELEASDENEDDAEGEVEEDLDELLLSVDGDEPLGPSLLVINGPNINMLGIREPSIYGNSSYEDLIELCKRSSAQAGFASCTCLQSNHEGDLVDFIQDALGTYDAIVINPGAYTHTSIAILDALKAVSIPAVEVHISDVDEREAFRKISYVRAACIGTVQGQGLDGYRQAIDMLAGHLGF